MNEKYMRYEKMLFKVAEAFRGNDMFFEDLSLEERTLLNDVGKILGIIHSELMGYRYANEDEKLKIRRLMHEIRHEIERRVEEMRKEG